MLFTLFSCKILIYFDFHVDINYQQIINHKMSTQNLHNGRSSTGKMNYSITMELAPSVPELPLVSGRVECYSGSATILHVYADISNHYFIYLQTYLEY